MGDTDPYPIPDVKRTPDDDRGRVSVPRPGATDEELEEFLDLVNEGMPESQGGFESVKGSRLPEAQRLEVEILCLLRPPRHTVHPEVNLKCRTTSVHA